MEAKKAIFVKPKVDLVLRHPNTKRVLSKEGEAVEDNNFWRRRILEGDVVLVEKEEESKETTVRESKKSGGK